MVSPELRVHRKTERIVVAVVGENLFSNLKVSGWRPHSRFRRLKAIHYRNTSCRGTRAGSLPVLQIHNSLFPPCKPQYHVRPLWPVTRTASRHCRIRCAPDLPMSANVRPHGTWYAKVAVKAIGGPRRAGTFPLTRVNFLYSPVTHPEPSVTFLDPSSDVGRVHTQDTPSSPRRGPHVVFPVPGCSQDIAN